LLSDEKAEALLMDEDENTKKSFRLFVSNRITSNTILVPVINGEIATLRDKEGYPNITLFVAELYNKPWIWYHCSVDGVDVIIKTMYIDDVSLLEKSKDENVSWLVKQLAPDAPNINNYTSFDNYKSISLIDHQLNDKNMQIMVTELKDDPRYFYKFIYDNLLVSIQSPQDILDIDVFNKLSFIELTLK
jgi:hypothetical protein